MEFSQSNTSTTAANLNCSFPETDLEMEEYKSQWLVQEPSWVLLQKTRLQRDLTTFSVNFDHSNEMGVTAKVAAGLNKMGFEIGGTYSSLKKRKYVFQVDFWPKKN